MIDLAPTHLETVRRLLAHHVPGCEVRAFGSRVKWTAKDYSDLDLAVVGEGKLPPGVLDALREAFTESDLPIRADVLDWHAITEIFRKVIAERFEVVQTRENANGGRGIASEWRASTWGAEISLEYGKALRDYDKAIGKYRVFGSNGPMGWTNKPLVSGPGVILGRKGAYRGIEFSRESFFVIDTAYYVVPKNKLNIRWIYYAIKYHKLGEIDDGSPIPLTTRSAVYVRDFDVPPLAEQKAIAAVLGALDDKIELNRRMNATLEAMARALFQSWFVDFDPVRSKLDGRTPIGLDPATAALFPASFQDCAAGHIPAGWHVMKFSEFINRLPVGQKYEQKTVLPVGKIPVLDQGKSGVIGYHNNEPGVTATLDEPVAVFANHTCYMRLITYPFSAIQNVLPFVGSGVDTFWAYYATEGRLSFSEYKGHWPDFVIQEAAVPPRELTDAFGRLAKPLVARIQKNDEESRALATLRDTLLSKLLSGELSVSDSNLHETTLP